MKDLVALVADQDARLSLDALLSRPIDLGFREISFEVIRHDNRDNGVFQRGHELLRTQSRRFHYAIAVCDRDGCGQERLHRSEIETRIEQNLDANGWEGRSVAIVIQPELEAWIWGDWHRLARCIRWDARAGDIRRWLADRNLLLPNHAKPDRPKEALLRAGVRHMRLKKDTLFAEMAQTADTAACTDQAC